MRVNPWILATAVGLGAVAQCGGGGPTVPAPSGPAGAPPGAANGVAYVGHNHSSVPLDTNDASAITKPSGTQTGDLLISAAMAPEDTPPVVPPGWTQIGGPITMGPGWPLYYVMVAAYRLVQSGDTSWTWTHSSATVTHAYRNVSATSPIHASRGPTRHQTPDPPIGNLAASPAGGDASVYICLGMYHANISHPPSYTARVESTAADYGSGDRLGLGAGQMTGGNLASSDDVNNDRGIVHVILRR